jgi:alpha-beta hydrolase superfamily lysophospholipase
MSHQEFKFNLYNTKFYGQYFKTDTVKGVVILVHGMGEHANRYTNFVIPKLLEKNLSVITYDQFGHGRTEGKRGHNPGYEAVLDCLGHIIDKAKEVFGDAPLFLYGHSMGGNVVINYALRNEHHLKGIIATSPLLRLAFKPPTWKLFLGKIIQKIAPSITMPSELDVNAISRDSTEVKKYTDDPLIHDKISPNYSLTFFETGEWAIKNAHKLQTPMLIIHGTGDQITDHTASIEFVNNSNVMASLELFENGYHELHNDLEKDKFIETLTNWILKTLN